MFPPPFGAERSPSSAEECGALTSGGRNTLRPLWKTHVYPQHNTAAPEPKTCISFPSIFHYHLPLSPSLPLTPPPVPPPSPLSAPQWPSPTQSLERCEWETACVTKAIRVHTCAHVRGAVQVKIHKSVGNNRPLHSDFTNMQVHRSAPTHAASALVICA